MTRAPRPGGAGPARLPALALGLALAACTGAEARADASRGARELDVPYLPTPEPVVARMLELADVGAGDYVIDLGSGDGRIVIEAARRGAIGHGVELDPERVETARRKAQRAGVDERVLFLQEDLFESEIRPASVVTLYLFREVNRELRPRLLERLRPGTRVVSHTFDMGAWRPDAVAQVSTERGALEEAARLAAGEAPEHSASVLGEVELRERLAWPPEEDARGLLQLHQLFLWIVPADARGRWRWEVAERRFAMRVEQRFQELDVEASAQGETLRVGDVELRGRRIAFVARSDEHRYAYQGRIEGDAITGTVQMRGGEDEAGTLHPWSARRVAPRTSRGAPSSEARGALQPAAR